MLCPGKPTICDADGDLPDRALNQLILRIKVGKERVSARYRNQHRIFLHWLHFIGLVLIMDHNRQGVLGWCGGIGEETRLDRHGLSGCYRVDIVDGHLWKDTGLIFEIDLYVLCRSGSHIFNRKICNKLGFGVYFWDVGIEEYEVRMPNHPDRQFNHALRSEGATVKFPTVGDIQIECVLARPCVRIHGQIILGIRSFAASEFR
uniref:Uncharacterized protein n=1 Tax=Candidatus Methanogaster sp. ANME-2c ERB4 TaxID=2759911 RepID=A0A7G9YQB6_9EURY|nr:hypothetical protein HHCNJNNG_00001 [Methanosarcinales archaeon ANME-2c ERB4]